MVAIQVQLADKMHTRRYSIEDSNAFEVEFEFFEVQNQLGAGRQLLGEH